VKILRVRRQLGRPRHEWDDNIKINNQEVVWEGIDWIDLTQNREEWWTVVNMVIIFQVI
jgi:hypothetical protein